MFFPRLDVQNDNLLPAAWSCPNLEVFAMLVPTDIENNARRFLARAAYAPAAAQRLAFQNLDACAHSGKVPIQITAHCFFLSKTAYCSRNVFSARSIAPRPSGHPTRWNLASWCFVSIFTASFRGRKSASKKNCWTGTSGQG